MVEVECVGVNEYNLHPQVFFEKFVEECKLEGNIIAIRSNGMFAAAMVVR